MGARSKAVMAVVLGLVILAVLVTRRAGDAAHPPAATPAEVTPTAAADPVAAAAEFLADLRPAVLLDPARREAVLARWADPDALLTLRRTYSREADRVRSTYHGAPLVSRSALLGYQLHSVSSVERDVVIWAMAIAADAEGVPATGWGTLTVRLRERAGTWHVVSVTTGAGPSPDETAAELARGAAAFHPFRHAR